jgi:hypothetical protein
MSTPAKSWSSCSELISLRSVLLGLVTWGRGEVTIQVRPRVLLLTDNRETRIIPVVSDL